MNLTPREQEIASYLDRGWKYQRIASELGISVETVDRHVRNAAAKIPGDGGPRHKCTLWHRDRYPRELGAA